MKYFAVFLMLYIGSNCICATKQKAEKKMNLISLQYYDSIRQEMIKTACEIGGIKDSKILNEIAKGRMKSAIDTHRIDSVIVELVSQSDRKLSGEYYKNYDSIARIIRANFMGLLLIQNYKNEDSILKGFAIHKKGLDNVYTEINDYIQAQKDKSFREFLKKHPQSKFCKLIPTGEKDKKGVDYFLIVIISVVTLIVIIITMYFAYTLKKSKKSLKALQDQMKGQSMLNNTRERILTQSHSSIVNTTGGETPTPIQVTEHQNLSEGDDHPSTASTISMENINAYTESHDGWITVGASVIGNSHISMGLPCQDNSKYVYVRNGWGIAITSDGAGSAKHSDIGSRIVVERGIHYFQSVIEQKGWAESGELPTDAEWTNIAYVTLKTIKEDLEKFAAAKNFEFKSLSATAIVVIHAPMGILVTHVGDGRAGYKDASGEWKALIVPHKGEEANQTIFLTSDFWNLPYYVMSGVMVPESYVIRCTPQAFTLMSDGCEHTAWQCYAKDEKTGMYYDPNKPHGRFFDPLVTSIANNVSHDLKEQWATFLTDGNDSFKKEPDDKTMILCVFK